MAARKTTKKKRRNSCVGGGHLKNITSILLLSKSGRHKPSEWLSSRLQGTKKRIELCSTDCGICLLFLCVFLFISSKLPFYSLWSGTESLAKSPVEAAAFLSHRWDICGSEIYSSQVYDGHCGIIPVKTLKHFLIIFYCQHFEKFCQPDNIFVASLRPKLCLLCPMA